MGRGAGDQLAQGGNAPGARVKVEAGRRRIASRGGGAWARDGRGQQRRGGGYRGDGSKGGGLAVPKTGGPPGPRPWERREAQGGGSRERGRRDREETGEAKRAKGGGEGVTAPRPGRMAVRQARWRGEARKTDDATRSGKECGGCKDGTGRARWRGADRAAGQESTGNASQQRGSGREGGQYGDRDRGGATERARGVEGQ
ncbi:RNA-binding protein cabeza-like [Sitophilus oryzae]|uniref:RNA-binding protein cabeza-like n=1 Tax=Sitophilus oryzae TaxID=7048 RepID=A0A6J2X2D0_SITOR|nr:RNA-binding protein cabeza-like [Sitophilus oryzae]